MRDPQDLNEPRRQSWLSRITVKQWASLVLVIVALIFILQNLQLVRVEFFLIHSTAPLWVVLLIALAAGYVIGRFSKRRD